MIISISVYNVETFADLQIDANRTTNFASTMITIIDYTKTYETIFILTSLSFPFDWNSHSQFFFIPFESYHTFNFLLKSEILIGG